MGEGLLDSQRPGQVKAAATPAAVSPEDQWQVLQEPDEQLLHPEDEALRRLPPPPMPNPEMSFSVSGEPHASQAISLSLPGLTRRSNLFPHFRHLYS
jgi:hypothetical protein